jgi:hypothetical protein
MNLKEHIRAQAYEAIDHAKDQDLFIAGREAPARLLMEAKIALERQRDAIAAVNHYRRNKNNPHAEKWLNSDIQAMWKEHQAANSAALIVIARIEELIPKNVKP